MSDLPDGWEWAALGELCEINPRTFEDVPEDDNEISLVRMSAVEEESGKIDASASVRYGDYKKKSLTKFQENDILFAKVTPCMENGKVAVARGLIGGRALGSSELFALRPHGRVSARYLMLWLIQPRVRSDAEKNMTGAVGLRRVPREYLEGLGVPLPPLAEQNRIADALDDQLPSEESGRAQIDYLLRRVERFRDDLYTGATSGFLAIGASRGGADPPAYAGVVDGELPRLPSTWTWRRLGEIAEVVGGATKDVKRQSDSSVPEFPYLRVANVQRARLDLSNVATMRIDPEKARRLTLQEGDVLLNEGGDRDKLGRGWIWEGQIAACVHQNHVFRVRVQNDALDPRLLAWHANGFGRRWFFRNGKQSTNLASVSLSTLKLLPVPVPPAGEQEYIVKATDKQLSMLDVVEQRLRRTRIRVDQLRQSLLREAFAGRLVPQDPDDEPASVLLERIRAERESTSKTKAPRQKRTGKSRASQAQQHDKDIDLSTSPPEAPGKGTQDALELDL